MSAPAAMGAGVLAARGPHGRQGGEAGGRGATCEGLVAAGDDDGAHLRVGLEGVERPPQLRHQPLAEGVQRLRPLQPDQAHAALAPRLLHLQELEGGPCPRPGSRSRRRQRHPPRPPAPPRSHRRHFRATFAGRGALCPEGRSRRPEPRSPALLQPRAASRTGTGTRRRRQEAAGRRSARTAAAMAAERGGAATLPAPAERPLAGAAPPRAAPRVGAHRPRAAPLPPAARTGGEPAAGPVPVSARPRRGREGAGSARPRARFGHGHAAGAALPTGSSRC